MATQAKKVATTVVQWLSWVYQTAKTLWLALRPVWNVLTTFWGHIKAAIGKLSSVWDYVVNIVKDFYANYIKPIWDFVEPAFDAINSALDWLNSLYDATIGRIENVYDILFGKWEDTWQRITDTEERWSRAIAIFSEETAQKLDDMFAKVEASTIGRVRDLRDELISKITDLQTWTRDNIAAAYYAIRDVVDPLGDDIKAIYDLLEIRFDKSGSLSKDTVVKSADTYGEVWWHETEQGEQYSTVSGEVDVSFYSETEKALDAQIAIMDEGYNGAWADVYYNVDQNIDNIDLGITPVPFQILLKLLPQTEQDMFTGLDEELER